MIWLLAILAVLLLAGVVYWQLIIAEGAYLGQRVVTLLYDRAAHEYDEIKEYGQLDEYYYLAMPLNEALGIYFDGLILDVAAGTGRVAEAMAQLSHFRGRVIAVDSSAKMLLEARKKMPQLPLVQADAMALPFADNSAEAVTSLEALEFLPRPLGGVAEMTSVLKPNGVLLTTHRVGWETKLMPGKVVGAARWVRMLATVPLTDIAIRVWETVDCFNFRAEQDAEIEEIIAERLKVSLIKRIILEFTTSRYQKVWARKPGVGRASGE